MQAILALLSMLSTAAPAPGAELPYVLDHPGVVFEWLPEALLPPVEGELTEESGSVTSGPSSDGAEYHIRYWREDIPAGSRADWLEQRLTTYLPPDALPRLLLGTVNWAEGGLESGERGSLSIGLVVSLSYNIINDSGDITARGRAFGAFRNGYSLLVYSLSPFESCVHSTAAVDAIVSYMHLAAD